MYENNTKDIQEAQNGSNEAMERLINDNNGLIWSIVKRFKDRGYELEDLYQIGSIGCIKSIKRFDTSFDVRLSTYAVPYILGEIKRFIRDDGPIKVSRSIKELAVKIKDAQKHYLMKYGKEPTIEVISKELKISKEEIASALDSINPVSSIYDEAYSDGEGSISVIDRISSNIDEPNMIADRLAIKQLINNLESRDKQLIMLRYYKGKTQTQVAKILGITQVQVSRIERKILDSMKMKLVI